MPSYDILEYILPKKILYTTISIKRDQGSPLSYYFIFTFIYNNIYYTHAICNKYNK